MPPWAVYFSLIASMPARISSGLSTLADTTPLSTLALAVASARSRCLQQPPSRFAAERPRHRMPCGCSGRWPSSRLRAAHRAEVRHLGRLGGQGIVVEGDGGVRIVGQIELVEPTELEASLGNRIVAIHRVRVVLGDVCGVAGDLVAITPCFTSSCSAGRGVPSGSRSTA